MADSHGADDPNVAPMHLEVKERFTSLQVAIAVAFGGIAIVLGTVLGLVLAND